MQIILPLKHDYCIWINEWLSHRFWNATVLCENSCKIQHVQYLLHKFVLTTLQCYTHFKSILLEIYIHRMKYDQYQLEKKPSPTCRLYSFVSNIGKMSICPLNMVKKITMKPLCLLLISQIIWLSSMSCIVMWQEISDVHWCMPAID